MKTPFITKEIAEEIAGKFPTPYYVYDEKGIEDNAEELLRAFSWNKGYKEYFAVKATPNPEILKLLKKKGCGVDCSSFTELLMAKECGFSGDEIMFSSNETPAAEFKLAKELNAIINLDDITHISFLKDAAGIPERICLRYNPGGEFSVNNRIMGNPADAKYGLTRAQLGEAVAILKKEGVKEFGLHAFLASNTLGNDYYEELARVIFKAIAELTEEFDVTFTFANLSGGIGVPYRPDQEKNNVFIIAKGVERVYNEILAKKGINVKIFTELGRYMLAPYGALITRAIHEKHIYKEYIGVDACAANLMRPAIYGAYHHITVLGKENSPNTQTYDVVGSLCENCDKFAVDRPLPIIDMGDLLFIHDAGAHGFSMGYNYNGKLRSAEILLQRNGTYRLIRRAETPEDYFATLTFLPEFEKYKK